MQKECFKSALSKERFDSVSWMDTSQSSFWECFCLVFLWRYFLFQHRLQSAPNEHLQILQKECFKTVLSKKDFNPLTWMNTTQSSFWECFCVVFIRSYFLFHHRPQITLNIHLQIVRKHCFKTAFSKGRFNSLSSMRISQGTVWAYFCLVFMWRYYHFHRRLQSAPKEHLQILQQECFTTAISKKAFTSVSWMHTSQSSFWECFCLVSMWRYFLFHHRPHIAPNIHLLILRKHCFKTALSKGRFNSVSWMHTSQSFLRMQSFLSLYEQISHLQRIPQRAPNILRQILQKECFKSDLSKETFNSVSWMHTSQNFLRMLLSSLYVEIFRLQRIPQRAPNILKKILHKQCFKNVVPKGRLNSVSWIHTSQKFSENTSVSFVRADIPFTMNSSRSSKYPQADSKKAVFRDCSIKRKVEFCELNPHITKKFLRMLLSNLYVQISRLQRIAQRAPNILKHILQKQYFKTALSKGRLNCVSWIHTSQKGFWECFCQVCADIPCTTNSSKSSKCPQHITKKSLTMYPSSLYVQISRLQRIPQRAPNILKQILQKECFKTDLSKKTFSSVSWMHTSQNFLRMLLSSLYVEISRLQRIPQRDPNILKQILHKQCFKNALWKGRLNSVS